MIPIAKKTWEDDDDLPADGAQRDAQGSQKSAGSRWEVVQRGQARAEWRKDLDAVGDVSPSEKRGFTLIIEWFESWRIQHRRTVDRESAFEFWRTRVKTKRRDG